ncbi:MAG: MFS transporter [Endomicrobium sp.]|jgi:sugar phosphate permease|nr:MFS transporter [Endomicrobium sp.]
MLSKLKSYLKPLPDAVNPITDTKIIAKKYKYWRIRMFLGMYISYLVFYLIRKGLPSVAPFFKEELHLTNMEYGILGSTMAVTYGVGKFLSGLLVDRCSIRSFLAIGLLGSSITTLFFGFFSSLPVLTFLWGLNGAFQSTGFPSCAKGIVYWFSQNERGTYWTLHSSSKTGGIALIGLMSTLFIWAGHWRYTFSIPALLGVIVSVLLFFTLTDKPQCVGLPPIDIYRNDTNNVKVEMGKDTSHWEILTKYVFGNPYLWIVAISAMLLYFVRFTMLDWSTIFMTEDRGISKTTAASLLLFMPLAGVLGGISCGIISDKIFKGRCLPASITYLLFLLLSLYGMFNFVDPHTSWWHMALILSAVGFFVEGPQSVAMGVLIARLSPKEAIGAATGFVGIFEYAGTFLAGVAAAAIISKFQWIGIFKSAGIACAAVILLLLLIIKKDKGN